MKAFICGKRFDEAIALFGGFSAETDRTDSAGGFASECEVTEVGPDFGFRGAAGGFKVADDAKVATVDFQLFADGEVFKASGHGAAGDCFERTRLHIPPFNNAKVGSEGSSGVIEAADDQVDDATVVAAGFGENGNEFHGTERTSAGVLCDAWQGSDV